MRYLVLTLWLLLPFFSIAQDKTKEYSYTELFQMIEEEEDSVFKLSDAKISYEPKTDSLFVLNFGDRGLLDLSGTRKDTLHIFKSIDLSNVQFDYSQKLNSPLGFHLISFHKPVSIRNPGMLLILESTFEAEVEIRQYKEYSSEVDLMVHISKSKFQGALRIWTNSVKRSMIMVFDNSFSGTETSIYHWVGGDLLLRDNRLVSAQVSVASESTQGTKTNTELLGNDFRGSKDVSLKLQTKDVEYFKVANNKFDQTIKLEIDDLSANSSWIKWDQFDSGLFDAEIFNYWMDFGQTGTFDRNGFLPDSVLNSQRNIDYYFDTVRVQDLDVYNAELAIRGKFYDYYQKRHEIEASNAVYREIKELETQRLAYLYGQNPGFNNFFKWKINQFLNLFSAYGTEPARAITMSVYVILAFALIYLFFPNHWDSHGKNRIMDRYRFFLKYVNKDSGMHEVYLDEKQPELLASEDFKSYLQEQGKTAPKFFMATALPLYKWSVAGTKSASWFLSKVDVLQGKWSDTEDSKKSGKSFLLITAFLIALVYDIFIKILNALMLSINTFTTLGFGEIPIKGLPRYLAIIQGFIGWFMLTIFSVSLISQLLN